MCLCVSPLLSWADIVIIAVLSEGVEGWVVFQLEQKLSVEWRRKFHAGKLVKQFSRHFQKASQGNPERMQGLRPLTSDSHMTQIAGTWMSQHWLKAEEIPKIKQTQKKKNKKSVAVTYQWWLTVCQTWVTHTLIHWQMFQTSREQAFTVNVIIMDYIK